jgi:ABC-2 type transport system ATP-binding protein
MRASVAVRPAAVQTAAGPPAVVVAGLRKSYGPVAAVCDVSFAVADGEIFALLGPNGAGKTSILEILEGFRGRDSGQVDVLGIDPAHRADGRELRERIGLVLQGIAVEPYLTVRETIARNAGYYPAPRDIGEVISLVGLAGKEKQKVRNLSGGQKRRLDLALGLIGHPELLFLDEPTTGFDPSARRDAWEIVRGLRDAGTTIVLTTHYMEEAQALADRVAVLSDGQIVAEGTPATIGGRDLARTRIRFARPAGFTVADLPAEADVVAGLPAGTDRAPGMNLAPGTNLATGTDQPPGAAPAGDLVTVETAAPEQALHALTSWAVSRGVPLDQLTVDRPSLEDVYLRLTSPAAAGSDPERGTR